MNDELMNKIESLKLMLVSYATGGGGDTMEYKSLRQELMATSRIAKLLPRFVHVCRDLGEFWSFIKPKFKSYAERREYLRNEFDPLLSMLETESRIPSDAGITATVKSVSSAYIQETWHKALERRATDTEGAITVARTLLESVCKHVLDAARATYDDSADLPKLYSLTAKQLNLSPSQHTEQLFKQILGGCQTVVEGVGALRNRHSDAYGRGASGKKPAPRHAELAVNLSGTMATFLLQTWEARKN
jgi:Abortive infection C-terminus